MGSEVLLYGYGAVCLSMLVFNIVNSIVMKKQEMRLERRSRALAAQVEIQMELIRQGKEVEQKHMRYLARKLRRVKNLVAFDRVMETYQENEQDLGILEYKRQIQSVLLQLAVVYLGRDTMQSAYFAYFLSRNRLQRHMAVDALEEILVQYMRKQNLYCRVNALEALCSFGSEESVVKALTVLNQEGGFIHEKILTDGLLAFGGDHDRLMALLWDKFERFSGKMQMVVLNYIRYKSGGYCERMFGIMTDLKRDKEQRLLAIRYFGRYVYEPAREALLGFASDQNPLNWEYAAVSVTSLARYTGEKVMAALIGAVHSANWYVRYNAAIGLESRDGYDWDMMEAAGGNDRYAREMLMYRLELNNARKGIQGGRI